ncbi:AMP-dependent synthetase [Sphaerisporangium krabiense]|uniref:Acyl-CoA synthetase (AMP-forming)/AMP-acid ligase II n=1 Tax=Sphaerisporangium krabiense TaxID=763782 RepID=A0A7W9DR43_9ACTN|nr:AMP-binding protein [Sphaerisporangium krabiense]MBB5628161.1 acyl-CoA synthetase (AMP-forming)/AMP-acid ligase II [Sphaerisporangium krabiense]GII62331.1 AMP-dependent synthetase [Sphaerisporangium krabiense]
MPEPGADGVSEEGEEVFPGPVLGALRASPGRVAFLQGGRAVTCGEVLDLAARLAAGMRDAGLGPGRGVAMATGLTPEAYAAHLAAHALGCRVAALRPGWSPRQTEYALGLGFDAVVTSPGGPPAPGLQALSPGPSPHAPGPRALFPGPSPHASGPRELSLGPSPHATDLLAVRQAADLTPRGRSGDIARLTFTSGSTGRPKACAQTYHAFTLAYRRERWPAPLAELMTGFGRCLISESLAGPVMMTYLGRCLIAGGAAVLPSGDDPEPLLPGAIERHRLTAILVPPPRLRLMLAALDERPVDVGSLRAVVLGGSPAGPGLLTEAVRRLGPIVWQGYGQGEAGVISMLTPDDLAREPAARESVGRPLPAVEVGLRRDGSAPVAPGEVGEIWVRSPHMMSGYWNAPEETAEVLRDGWLHTRDLGYLGPTGLLHLSGRSRDVIMVNAEVCHGGAVERVLAGHPAVAEACVLGAGDAETGEAFHAFVVPAAPVGREDLLALVRGSLSAGHVPRTITVVGAIPLTPAGKPDKEALAALVPAPGPPTGPVTRAVPPPVPPAGSPADPPADSPTENSPF